MSSDHRNRAVYVIYAVLAGLAFAAALEVPLAQTAPQAEPTRPETFTGTTVNLSPGAGETISIHILRWSPDADRDGLEARRYLEWDRRRPREDEGERAGPEPGCESRRVLGQRGHQ